MDRLRRAVSPGGIASDALGLIPRSGHARTPRRSHAARRGAAFRECVARFRRIALTLVVAAVALLAVRPILAGNPFVHADRVACTGSAPALSLRDAGAGASSAGTMRIANS